jgi:hypothetical protein
VGQRAAVIGGALYEDLGRDEEDVDAKIRRGEIVVSTCHAHSSVGSVAGIFTASMPVVVVENQGRNAVGGRLGREAFVALLWELLLVRAVLRHLHASGRHDGLRALALVRRLAAPGGQPRRERRREVFDLRPPTRASGPGRGGRQRRRGLGSLPRRHQRRLRAPSPSGSEAS